MNKIIQQKQLYQMILARLKEIIREPGVIFWGMVFPMLMSLGLGIAFMSKTDIFRKVAVITDTAFSTSTSDTSLTPESFFRKNAAKIKISGDGFPSIRYTIKDDKLGNSTFLFEKMRWNKALVLLKRGSLSIILSEKNGKIEYHFDPMNPDAQLTYLKLSKIFQGNEIQVKENHENIQPLTVSGTRYIDFLIPGLIAMGVMMSSMWGI